ncbi:F-box only protein 47-like isoform X2 [Apostichopus japonicus]|uniref:F-box only protein 47-like isoform X2 n=1 Tax=Stichopus japonicus TaxID=307972 RepID=UPI003AB71503
MKEPRPKNRRLYLSGSNSCLATHHKQNYQQASPLGFFDSLPHELIFNIFHFASTEDLSKLSISSVALSHLVRNFLSCKSILKCFLWSKFSHTKLNARWHLVDRLFTELGLLLKRSTFLLPTRERLVLMGKFTTKIYQVINVEKSHKLFCLGNFYSMFTKGWSQKECGWAFKMVMEHFKIKSKLATVLTSAPGTFPEIEYEIRTFLCHVFVTNSNNITEHGLYLEFILKPYPLVHQAKILYLMHGPADTDNGLVDWQEMSSPLPDTGITSMDNCSSLALAIKILFGQSSWSEGSVNSVLKELTDCPQEWTTRNVAKLLLLCGEAICFNFVVSIALNGKMREVANIFVTLSMIIKEENLQMAWLLNLVHRVCRSLKNTHDINSLLDAIPELYKDLTVDLQEIPDAEEPS